MKIAFLINNIQTEESGYATVKLALTAAKRGHKVWFIGVDDLAYYMKEKKEMFAKACTAKVKKKTSEEAYLSELKGVLKEKYEKISLEELDVLMLRNNPAEESQNREWAKSIGIDFGRLLARKGVIVLNSPTGLSYARDKMYLQNFPEKIRPKTVITKDKDEIKEFFKNSNKMILKPLAGSKGKNVFLINKNEAQNINQIIDAVGSEGYIIAQEYISEAEDGDIRLLMMNGEPLQKDGKYAAFKRVRSEDDIRNNVSVGAKVKKAVITKEILEIAEIVRPRLAQDGMFLVGLDVVGNKVLEVNVFSPGGLGNAEKMEGVDFSIPIVDAIERKVGYMKCYNKKINSHHLATI